MTRAARTMATAPTHVALLRAINVGGHVVTMERLRALFAELGHTGVETFIASGNVLFTAARSTDAPALEAALERHLHASLGWEVATFLRTPAELAAIAARRPFGPPPPDVPKTNEFVAFLKTAPPADAQARVLAFRSAIDDFVFDGRELHWQVHGSSLDSKLNGNKLEKLLGGSATVRSVTTVRKLVVRG